MAALMRAARAARARAPRARWYAAGEGGEGAAKAGAAKAGAEAGAEAGASASSGLFAAGYGKPMTWRVAGATLVTGAALTAAYFYEKERRFKEILASKTATAGEAAIGGPFSLRESVSGKTYTDKDLIGKWTLLYFGFTACPDVCPEEMEKLAEAIDMIEKVAGEGAINPVFISIDPERDSLEEVREYVKKFHKRMVGLTGSVKQCNAAARSYRVYHHKTSEDADYLVDHSIIHYLVGPDGKFRKFFLKSDEAKTIASGVLNLMADEFKAERAQKG